VDLAVAPIGIHRRTEVVGVLLFIVAAAPQEERKPKFVLSYRDTRRKSGRYGREQLSQYAWS
jgi:hypothetical protein